MSTPAVRELVAPAIGTGASLTATTGAGTAVGDLLVLIHGYDYYAATNMLTPTGTAGTWTLQCTGDGGTNRTHIKVWTRPVSSGGAQTVTVNSSGTNDATHFVNVYVLNGSTLTLAVDGAAGQNGTGGGTSHDCPSVSPTGADDLLICAAGAGPDQNGDYTAPSGMTKQNELDNTPFSTMATFTQTLSASGATGTKSATFTANEIYAAVSIAISGTAGGSTPAPRPPVVSTAAVQRAASW